MALFILNPRANDPLYIDLISFMVGRTENLGSPRRIKKFATVFEGRRGAELKKCLLDSIQSSFIISNRWKNGPEYLDLLKYIIEQTRNVEAPMNLAQLARDFKEKSGAAETVSCLNNRIGLIRTKIHSFENIDMNTKVRMMFALSASINPEFLEELQKDAFVGVDEKNRITHYKGNDGSLELGGNRSLSAKQKTAKQEKKKKVVAVLENSNKDSDMEGFNGDSDEYSIEEFDSEFDSDDENDPPDELEDLVERSNGADNFENENAMRSNSPSGISIDNNFDFDFPTERSHVSEEMKTRSVDIAYTGYKAAKTDLLDPPNEADDSDNETSVKSLAHSGISTDNNIDFDPPTEKSHTSEETGMKETVEEETNPAITGNAVIKTRSGRLSKKRHLDSEFSFNLTNFDSSEATMSTNSASSKPAKQQKIAIEKEESARTTREKPSENMENQDATSAERNPSDYHSPRIQGIEDYDYNPREDNTPESNSIDNRIQESETLLAKKHNKNIETQNTDNKEDVDAPEPKPEKECHTLQNKKSSTPKTNGKDVTSQEVPIKVENEEPVGNPSKDVKPETTHNFKFFNAMQSLIISLDTPFLSNLQSKIKQKIRKIGRSGEMISNDEMILTLELLAARMANHSVIDISEGVESVSLIQFFCYLKASILNSKMIGVEGLVAKINKRIENSQNKSITMEKVANALRASLDIDGF